ncbi:hypothetical protein K458DRAFT_408088 [Lentithecium fluviatile CBS 122367]|uniref:Uncharacterized protein n=1 Tax=Lentithecium fluviatile CBS 122367 TaxID=1168545 RepID=A0A6G1INA3_9PLEO|nr:hypothetical protein K458DRAFT_408088 [Lentithecium fluviatile CBS 122367]
MVVVRKWGEHHINKSLKQIDSNTWLVGDLVLHRSPCPSDAATWNDDGDFSSYTLTPAPIPLPSTTSLDSPYVKLVHEAGDASAVWCIGNGALCKVRDDPASRYRRLYVMCLAMIDPTCSSAGSQVELWMLHGQH